MRAVSLCVVVVIPKSIHRIEAHHVYHRSKNLSSVIERCVRKIKQPNGQREKQNQRNTSAKPLRACCIRGAYNRAVSRLASLGGNCFLIAQLLISLDKGAGAFGGFGISRVMIRMAAQDAGAKSLLQSVLRGKPVHPKHGM